MIENVLIRKKHSYCHSNNPVVGNIRQRDYFILPGIDGWLSALFNQVSAGRIKRRVERIEITGIDLILRNPYRFTETGRYK